VESIEDGIESVLDAILQERRIIAATSSYPTNEYVAGALSLYLDAFNIFLALLRILNRR